MKHNTLFLWFFLLVTSSLIAQDEGFSAYRFAALAQNPAESGRIETAAQLSVLYRTQWNTVIDQGYQSAYAGFESQLFCPGNSYFGLGISAAYERAGSSDFTRLNGNVALAYHQQLNPDLFLAGGGEVGVLSYRIDAAELRFDEQFNGEGYDPTLPSFESFANLSTIAVDAAIGALLYHREGRWSVGASVNHLTAPAISFLEDSQYNVAVSSTIYGNFSLPVQRNVLNFHLMYKNCGFVNNRQDFFLAGADLLLPLGNTVRNALPSYLDLDVAVRIAGGDAGSFIGDAIIATGRFSIEGWQFGVSYDFNISPLATTSNSFGALEGFIGFPISKEKKCVRCPRMNSYN